MNKITNNLSEQIELIARRAGDHLMKRWPGIFDALEPAYPRHKEPLTIQTKQDGTSVTDADLAANEIILAGLSELFPEHELVSEEGPLFRSQNEREFCWVIDPLDGTSSFIKGKDDFSVLLALIQNDTVIYGCMYFPVKQIMATAVKGEGAYVDGKRVQVSQFDHVRESSLFLSKFSRPNDIRVYPEWMDSGMALLNVATGAMDGAIIKMVTHQEWDIAAPSLILAESGGIMSDEYGKPIKFRQPAIEFNYTVASNSAAQLEVLAIVNC